MNSSHNFTNLDSEENINDEINELNDWNEKYGIYLKDYTDRINLLLLEHSNIALNELSNLFYDKQFIEHYKSIPSIAYMIVIMTIYMAESSDSNFTKTILDHGHSIDELISHFKEIKFLLWNIEFDVDKTNALIILNDFIKNKYITITELTYIIQSASINRVEVFLNISHFFRSSDNTQDALSLLLNSNSIFFANEPILCEIADIYFQAGCNEVALKFINMIEHESENTKHLKNKWGLI